MTLPKRTSRGSDEDAPRTEWRAWLASRLAPLTARPRIALCVEGVVGLDRHLRRLLDLVRDRGFAASLAVERAAGGLSDGELDLFDPDGRRLDVLLDATAWRGSKPTAELLRTLEAEVVRLRGSFPLRYTGGLACHADAPWSGELWRSIGGRYVTSIGFGAHGGLPGVRGLTPLLSSGELRRPDAVAADLVRAVVARGRGGLVLPAQAIHELWSEGMLLGLLNVLAEQRATWWVARELSDRPATGLVLSAGRDYEHAVPDQQEPRGGVLCHRPWTGFELFDHLGDVRPCCWGKLSCGNVNSTSASAIWNGPVYKRYREKMLAGDIEEICQPECPIARGLYRERLGTDAGGPRRGSTPRYLRVVPSIACNLRCPMCYQLEDPPVRLPRDLFDQLHPWLADADEFLVLGGEPFIAKPCLEWIERLAPDRYPGLGLTAITNGLGFTPAVCDLIRQRHWRWILVSVDAASAPVYARVRGGDFDALREGLGRLASVRATHEHPFEIRFGFTVQKSNLGDAVAFLDLCETYGALPQYTMVFGDWHRETPATSAERRTVLQTLETIDKALHARGFSHRLLAPVYARARRQQALCPDGAAPRTAARARTVRAAACLEVLADAPADPAELARRARLAVEQTVGGSLVVRLCSAMAEQWGAVEPVLAAASPRLVQLQIPYAPEPPRDELERWRPFVDAARSRLEGVGHTVSGYVAPSELGVPATSLAPAVEVVFEHRTSELIELSVVAPAYDAAAEIGGFLRSLSSQRTSHVWELVVVDDGSRDGTADAARRCLEAIGRPFDVVVLRLGRDAPYVPDTFTFRAGAARQAGVAVSRGEHLVFLHPDQVVEPDCLEMHAFCAQYLAPVVVGQRREHQGVACARIWPQLESSALGALPDWWLYFSAGNSSVKRSLFDRVGGFDTALQYRGLDDIDLGYRLHASGEPVWHTVRAGVRRLATRRPSGGWTRAERVRSNRVHRDVLYRKYLRPEILDAFAGLGRRPTEGV